MISNGGRIRTLSLCALLWLVLASASFGAEIGPELLDTVSKLGPGEKIPVLVRFKDHAETEFSGGHGRTKREEIIRALKTKTQDSVRAIAPHLISRRAVYKDLWIINGVSLKADAAMLSALSREPRVKAVTLDAELPGPVVGYGYPAVPEWNLSMIKAPELWSIGLTGADTVVATMDTGVDLNHPDLASSWRGGTNSWYDPYGDHPAPFDASGHGTMVAGIINGGANGGTAIGVAPGAKWIGVKIFRDNGHASLSAIHQGFQWLLDPDGDPATDDSPQIVNSSWGLGNINGCSSEFEEDIRVLNGAGIITIFAAGNYGPNQYTSTSPANSPVSVSTGAIDYAGAAAGFSSRGPSACGGSVFPLIAAPGVDIRTADLTYGGAVPRSYSVVSGTSFAAAHVSGALALLAEAFPAAAPDELTSALLSTVQDLGQYGADNAYGAGLIQLKAAYDLLAGQEPAPVIDQDDDSYPAGADCNENDPSIHPGAVEIKYDGIDQDCNGYDLTITITRATYSDTYRSLRIEAKSSLGAGAALSAEGFGPMSWSANLNKWVLTVKGIEKPSDVKVSGLEGSELLVLAPPAPKPEPEPLPLPVPQPEPSPTTDMDGDGYAAGQDCDDSDPSIHPGAIEVRLDNIDQDCNGYDLTITVTRATYSATYRSLRVEAKSLLGADAALNVNGLGPMNWSANLNKWVLTLRLPQKPLTVKVEGVEGFVEAQVE